MIREPMNLNSLHCASYVLANCRMLVWKYKLNSVVHYITLWTTLTTHDQWRIQSDFGMHHVQYVKLQIHWKVLFLFLPPHVGPGLRFSHILHTVGSLDANSFRAKFSSQLKNIIKTQMTVLMIHERTRHDTIIQYSHLNWPGPSWY